MSADMPAADEYPENREMIKKVIAYMEGDISCVSLDSAAEHVNTTPIYLSIIFKEVEGIHFKECLIQKKIEKAKRLLEDTELRIYEIGALVGYADIKYFSKMSTKVFLNTVHSHCCRRFSRCLRKKRKKAAVAITEAIPSAIGCA